MDIKEAVAQLSKLLVNTKEFIELSESKRVINANPKSIEVLDNLQKKQELIYNGTIAPDKLPQYMKEVDADYRNLALIPEIGRYFKASEDFSRLLTNVFNEINASVEKNIR